MANTDNLMPIQEVNSRRTREQHSKDSRKAGQKSGEARREKRLIKDRILERMGEADWDAYIDGIIERAKDSKADAEFLRDTIGEKPVDRVAIGIGDKSIARLREDFEEDM